MMSVLKPNKANLAGTLMLLAANWVAGFVPRLVTPLLMAGNAVNGAASAGRGAFAAGAGSGMRSGGYTGGAAYGLLGSAAGLIVAALLFYVIISFVVVKLAKSEEATPEPKKK